MDRIKGFYGKFGTNADISEILNNNPNFESLIISESLNVFKYYSQGEDCGRVIIRNNSLPYKVEVSGIIKNIKDDFQKAIGEDTLFDN